MRPTEMESAADVTHPSGSDENRDDRAPKPQSGNLLLRGVLCFAQDAIFNLHIKKPVRRGGPASQPPF